MEILYRDFCFYSNTFLLHLRGSLGANVAHSTHVNSSSEVSSLQPWLLHEIRELLPFSCFFKSIIVSPPIPNMHLYPS